MIILELKIMCEVKLRCLLIKLFILRKSDANSCGLLSVANYLIGYTDIVEDGDYESVYEIISECATIVRLIKLNLASEIAKFDLFLSQIETGEGMFSPSAINLVIRFTIVHST